MAKTWKAELTIFIFNPPEWEHLNVEVPISDEEYEKLNEAISNGTELSQLPFYSDLENRARNELDPNTLGENPYGEPEREDFESEEEFQEALEEYNNWEFDDYEIMDIVINDPGEYARFKKAFVGRKVDEDCDEGIDLSDYESNPQREARVHLQLSDDRVIEDVEIESMTECSAESERHVYFESCEPDYWWIQSELERYLDFYWAD